MKTLKIIASLLFVNLVVCLFTIIIYTMYTGKDKLPSYLTWYNGLSLGFMVLSIMIIIVVQAGGIKAIWNYYKSFLNN